MINQYRQQAPRIAASTRKFALVFDYSTGSRKVGEIFSTHTTRALAERASKHSGYDTFLSVRDSREDA